MFCVLNTLLSFRMSFVNALCWIIIASKLVMEVAASCFGCLGGRRTSKIHPVPECEQNLSALFDDQPAVTYFRVREALPNNMKDVAKFIVLGITYSIVEMVDYLGWHLPLKHSHSAHTFQSIVDYFSEFEGGVDKLEDPYRVKMGFGTISPLHHPISC